MKVKTYTSAAIFDHLADKWNSLLQPARPESLFLRVEWQRLWWQRLGRGDLNIVAVYDDTDRLLGVAPWFIEQADGQRTLRTVGCVEVADYLDVIGAPHAEYV